MAKGRMVEHWVRDLPEVGDVLIAHARKIENMKAERDTMLRLIRRERKALEAHARKLWSGVEVRAAREA